MAKRALKEDKPSFIKKGREAVENAGTSGNGQTFLKLADGESVEIVVIGGIDEIISFDQHAFWLDEGDSPIFPCSQDKDCPGCMLNNQPRFKAIIPVMVKTESGQEGRLLVFGKKLMQDFADAEDAVGASLHGQIVRYSRKGSGMTTKYSLMPTGRSVKVPTIEEFEPKPIDNIGPTDREEIVRILTEKKLWKFSKSSGKSKVEDSWDDEKFVDIDDDE